MAERELVDTIIAVFYPFIAYIMKDGFSTDAIICLVLFVVFNPASRWWYWMKKENKEFLHVYLLGYLPPVGLMLATGKGFEGDVITCLLLWFVCFVPGLVYAHWKC